MAIDFVNVTIKPRGAGDCAIGLVAYIRCEECTRPPQGRRHSAGFRTCSAAATAIKARTGPDPLDGTILRTVLSATTPTSRPYGLVLNVPPHRRNAALTRRTIVSLPKELLVSEMRQLAIDRAKPIRRGRAVNAIFRH